MPQNSSFFNLDFSSVGDGFRCFFPSFCSNYNVLFQEIMQNYLLHFVILGAAKHTNDFRGTENERFKVHLVCAVYRIYTCICVYNRFNTCMNVCIVYVIICII